MLERLVDFARDHRRLFVLTGAGVSTASGIPDYRDADGQWKRRRPVQYGDFVRKRGVRQRYWARSLLGWPQFSGARPGVAHHALAALEQAGHVAQLVTQNVDRLHQEAGSRQVIDLHGRLDRVSCLDCGCDVDRESLQTRLEECNPSFRQLSAAHAPDGDADLEGVDFERFLVPDCPACGGMLKPAVVFFGESVPRDRVGRCFAELEAADGVLVVGSSLMVWSGYRFAHAAARQGKPVVAINRGKTRADEHLAMKIDDDCGTVLRRLSDALA